MESTHETDWERSLARLAGRVEYPATPDIAAAIRSRTTGGERRAAVGRRPAGRARLAWALILVALLAIGLLAVPQTRAAVLSFFARVGAIELFIDEAAPTPAFSPRPTAPPTRPTVDETGSDAPLPTATERMIEHSLSLFQLGEPTTLAEAREAAGFPLLLPAALGEPDEVYVHRNVDLPAVSLVWRDPAGAPLSLTEIGVAEFAMKLAQEGGVRAVRVAGRPAYWLEGPHMLQLLGNWQEGSLLINSNVLLWAVDEVTYRLEGELSEEEMVAIAESVSSGP